MEGKRITDVECWYHKFTSKAWKAKKKKIPDIVLISDLKKIGKNVERENPLHMTEGDRKSLLSSYEFQRLEIFSDIRKCIL